MKFKRPKRETQNEINFMIADKTSTDKYVAIINKFNIEMIVEW